ncbi:DUF6752 domain-containing protein [Nocardioides iriomotensis]|jgi:uncharacterized protein DUF6752|uniref:DUF6752 domain-containing protein n=1 Tax=Nocardioides iriomotensis TaxID=715784 RepID=UPI001F0DE495|nr:DUF6752 domain-containing protein [Nocardioides iriomotensis]
MATMNRFKSGLRTGAEKVARLGAGAQIDELRDRVTVLEEEVQEARQVNLRLAELVDVVQELLLPVAQRDEAKVAEAVERFEKYSKGL